jgi:hypothetical protein
MSTGNYGEYRQLIQELMCSGQCEAGGESSPTTKATGATGYGS